MDTEPRPTADDTEFPSGPWVGYYIYGSGSRDRHRMDLDLRFRDGLVRGTGVDDVDRFSVRGHYDRESHIVTWHKNYPNHDVWYRGFREGRGIWGTWEIGSHSTGGFMIWPKGSGGELEATVEAEIEEPVPAAPASPGAQPLH